MNELKIKLLKELGLYIDNTSVQHYENCGYLTENTDIYGNDWFWYMDNECQACINMEGTIITDEEEIIKMFNI